MDTTTLKLSDGAAVQRNQTTKTPPPLVRSSMTPPPTSEAPNMSGSQSAHSRDPMRTPTPTHSHLSSPPPTVKGPAPIMNNNGYQDGKASESMDSLRAQLRTTKEAHERTKAQMSALNLQFHLVWVEHNESKKRAEVELEMMRKDLEVTLHSRERGGASTLSTPITPNARPALPSPSDQEVAALRNRCATLQIDNDHLHDRIEDMEIHWSGRVEDLERENGMLRERLRDNRRHLNQLRAAGAFPDYMNPGSMFNTPRTGGRTLQQTPSSLPQSSTKPGGHALFDQLLLADQVLNSQEATAPSTPTPHSRRQKGHQRGVQSLSSLPTTPVQARSVPHSARAPPPYFTPMTARAPQVPNTAPAHRHHRRKSRDSTISAEEVAGTPGVDFEQAMQSSPEIEDVEPSRASQEAASMLRKSFSSNTPQGSQRSDAPKSSGLLQSKLGGYGKITKAASGKRKPSGSPAATHASPTKKRSEGVGLGIGGWESHR